MKKKLSKELSDRLWNGKFEQAKEELGEKSHDKKTTELINALSDTFGDSGWMGGNMQIIIDNAIENIGVKL